MYSQITSPEERLSKDVVKIWRIRESIGYLIGFIFLSILFYVDYYFSWNIWVGRIIIGITTLTLLSAVWSIVIQPFLHYKYWRYSVNAEFLQLKTGAFNQVHQLVPMTKIQSVATNQGPLLRKYGLYSISIETMGSSHGIPALPEEVALELRNQIAHFAKIKEVE